VNKEMKNVARLILVFTLSFIVCFILFALIKMLGLWIEALRTYSFTFNWWEFISAVQWALPITLYTSVLFTLSYSVWKGFPAIPSMVLIGVLALGFSVGLVLGIDQAALIPAVSSSRLSGGLQGDMRLGGPGLLLARENFAVVLLNDPRELRGARVVSIPGKPLIYQEDPIGPENKPLERPPVSLGSESAYFLESIGIDFTLTAMNLMARLKKDFLLFLYYIGALILLLISCRCILQLSRWPLANLFLAALAYRGILALDTYLYKPDVLNGLGSFLQNRFPDDLINPCIFVMLSLIIILLNVLVSAAGRRRTDED
jgi:hypothetical protein